MAPDQRRTLKRSQAQERKTAEIYKGSRQPGSGSGWLRKNDVRSDQYLIENKTRARPDAKSITLKGIDLVGVVNKAAMEDRVGLLQFDLMGKRWVVLLEDDFLSA